MVIMFLLRKYSIMAFFASSSKDAAEAYEVRKNPIKVTLNQRREVCIIDASFVQSTSFCCCSLTPLISHPLGQNPTKNCSSAIILSAGETSLYAVWLILVCRQV